MEYRPLGRTSIRVSRIGLGCVTFGREIDQAASFAVADRALERGITHFDTAEAYHKGESERVLGRWVRQRGVRDQVVIATKATHPLNRQRLIAAAEASLKNLQMERVDLYYLHAHPEPAELVGCLEAMGELVRRGLVRSVACSNFAAPQLDNALKLQDAAGLPRMAAIQPIYNLVSRDIESAMLPLCQREQVGTITYSPLGAGFLTGKYHRDAPPPAGARFDILPGHQKVYFHDDKWSVMEALRAKSAATGISMIHLALAWALHKPDVTCTLIGARSPAQVDQAFEAMEHPGISGQLLAAMDAMRP